MLLITLEILLQFDNSAEMVIENTLNNIDEDGAAGESEHHRFWGKDSFFKDLLLLFSLA